MRKAKKYLIEFFRLDGKLGSPNLTNNMKNFMIDIDGVICEDIPNEEPERMITAVETLGVREKINKWYDDGHMITFFTARTENLNGITEKWLKDHGFKYHNIIYGKPRGGNYHYIDDKNIRATKFRGDFGYFTVNKNLKRLVNLLDEVLQ